MIKQIANYSSLFLIVLFLYGFLDGRTLKYGNTITLLNTNINSYLVANKIYHNNAGQNHTRELVCGHKTIKSKWRIVGPDGTKPSYKKDEPVKTGDIIRLQHIKTNKYLYSEYGALSPVRKEQEVSLISPKKSSAKTNWLIVGPLGSNTIVDDKEIKIGKKVKIINSIKLVHAKTNAPLHAGNSQLRKKITVEHSEKDHKFLHVSAFTPGKRDEDNLWSITIMLTPKK